MTASPPVDRSLFELAAQAAPAAALQLSPTTFKSMVSLLFDFLLEQKTAAIVWVKLPKGAVWQAELERFCQASPLPHRVYLLQTEAERLNETTSKTRPGTDARSSVGSPRAGSNPLYPPVQLADWTDDLMDVTVIEAPVSKAAGTTVHPLLLTADTQLKREYFVLAVMPNFYGLLLAQRPRSFHAAAKGGSSRTNSDRASLDRASLDRASLDRASLDRTSMDSGELGGAQTEETTDRKHPLSTLYSFDAALMQAVLAGIDQSIACGPLERSAAGLPLTWEDLQAQGMAQCLDPLLLSQLLTRQVQRLEDLWRSSASERQRAKQATDLQQENQALLTTLQQKSEFVQTLGQELRTPLATMKTALSLLNSPNLKPPQRQKYMEMLSRECDRQNSLISSGLSLLQIENGAEFATGEPLRLSEIIPGVVSTYQPIAEEKGLRLAYTVPEDLPSVDCSPNILRQVVINLLHNSIKFTPKGGQVWVKAKPQDQQILVEFRDTGIGIAPSELPKIFDRFYRGRQSGEDSGVGLGLTIVQQLVHRAGGSISVKSKPGEGTLFIVVLPVRAAAASED